MTPTAIQLIDSIPSRNQYNLIGLVGCFVEWFGSDISKLGDWHPSYDGYRVFALNCIDHDDDEFLLLFFDTEDGNYVFACVHDI